MRQSEQQSWAEKTWRTAQAGDDQAPSAQWLAAHPAAQAACADDLRLTEMLNQMENVPVPSNFTALVLQAALRQPAAPRRGIWHWRFLLRPALLAPVLGLALLAGSVGSWLHHQRKLELRTEVARNMADLAHLAPDSPGVDALLHFEEVRSLSQAAEATPDVDLLVAFSQ